MNNQKRFPEEFKIEAIKQVTERGHRVAAVAARLDASQHSLYAWIKQYSLPPEQRDILKKAAAYFAKQSG